MKRLILLLGVICTLTIVSCESENEHESEEETVFPVTNPVVKDTSITAEYVAQIKSIQNIEIRTQERGYLKKIYVDEGQMVKKGQLLFKIMPKLYKAEMQKAQAEAQHAKIEYQNTQKLADSNVVAPNELAMAKADYDQAQAQLQSANAHLSFTTIRAPYPGIIDRLHQKTGSLLDEGELLTTLSDNSEMWVYFNVPEAEYLDYKQHHHNDSTQVQLRMANDQIYKYPGVVQTIEGEFNNETGNIAFRAGFKNPDGLLRHGETGNIIMKVPLKNAMLIPQKATYEILDKRYVFTVDDEDHVHSKKITVASEMEDLYVVSDGLSKNDRILLEGIRKVRDGNEIETEFKDPQQVISNLKLYAE